MRSLALPLHKARYGSAISSLVKLRFPSLLLHSPFIAFAYGRCVRTGNYVIIFSSLRIFVSRHDTASVNAAVRLFTQSFGACRSGCEAMADGRFGTDNFSDI